MIMLASTLLCSKFSKRCYMTMGPFRPRRNTTITHHHRNPFRLANLSGTGCNGGHAVVTLHPWQPTAPSWQPASVNSHKMPRHLASKAWNWDISGFEELLDGSSWRQFSIPKNSQLLGVFFGFQSTKFKTKTNKLLEISTNLRYKKTISHILRLFWEFATLLIVRIGLHHREWQTLSAFPANCSS